MTRNATKFIKMAFVCVVFVSCMRTTTKYMTLVPKFYAKLVSAITRRRMNENQRFLGESSQNFT